MYNYDGVMGVIKIVPYGYSQIGLLLLFIIKSNARVFEVFGCPDPQTPAHGYIKRERDRAEIYCLISEDDIWEIFCHEGVWKGDIGNCSAGKWIICTFLELETLGDKIHILDMTRKFRYCTNPD